MFCIQILDIMFSEAQRVSIGVGLKNTLMTKRAARNMAIPCNMQQIQVGA